MEELDRDSLLNLIDEVRTKAITSSNLPVEVQAKAKEDLAALIKRAQNCGVYPEETVEGNPNTVATMVSGWGARWIEYREPLVCKVCGASLIDERVGPPFKREVALYSMEQDRTIGHYCPDCKVAL